MVSLKGQQPSDYIIEMNPTKKNFATSLPFDILKENFKVTVSKSIIA